MARRVHVEGDLGQLTHASVGVSAYGRYVGEEQDFLRSLFVWERLRKGRVL